MNTPIKIILVLAGGAMLLCLLAGAAGLYLFRSTGSTVSGLFDGDLARADRTGREIIDYQVPEGFTEASSTEIGEYKFVSYTGSDGNSHIYLFQLPPEVTIDLMDMEKELQKAIPSGSGRDRNARVVETRPGTIAGQEVTLVISEGTNHEGDGYREVSAAFQGKGGQALVVFSRPTASWDEAEVDAFLASMR